MSYYKNHSKYLPFSNFQFSKRIYHWLDPFYNRVYSQYKLTKYKIQGFYFFKLKYFDEWEKSKLDRYLGWQLSEGGNRFLTATEISIDEYKALQSIFKKFFPKQPEIIVDFGCGLGRSSIFFKHMFKWESSKFVFIDSHRQIYGSFENNYSPSQSLFHQNIKNLKGNFYTDFDLIDRFLLSNDMQKYDLLDLREEKDKLLMIKNVDLFYSFHSIGYHYDILNTFDYYKIHDLLKPGALLIFGIRRRNDPLRNKLKIDKFIKQGYKKLALIEGNMLQDYLLMTKVRK